eukprot:5392793-Ditylum_brightwellii.AAC.1
MDAGREEKYWCYASTDVIRKYTCTLRSAIGNCLYFTWSGIRPSVNQWVPWDCVIYPHKHDTKDPAQSHTEGYYFGITNSSSLVEWLDPETKTMKHCNTTQFDEHRTHVGDDKPMPGTPAIGEQTVSEKDPLTLTINTSDQPYFTKLPNLF